MKKKLAAIAMATAMAASLAACSSKPAETTAAAEENEETTAEAAEGSEAAEAGEALSQERLWLCLPTLSSHRMSTTMEMIS